MVVGADGRYSAVARLGGFETEYEHHDFDVIWFTIDQPPGWSSTFYVSLGKVRGLMLPKYPQQIQAGILLPTGEWRRWRQAGVAAVAERVRQFDPIFAPFAASLTDFKPFFPLEGIIRFVRDWARDGLLLIGDAAHTMSPAGAIGVNVAIATAAVAAQVLLPHLGKGPIPHDVLAQVQRLREEDVRTLHRLQLGAQRVLLGQGSANPLVRWLAPRLLPLLLRSPLLPRCSAGSSSGRRCRRWTPPSASGSRRGRGGVIASGSPARRTRASPARPRRGAAWRPGRTRR